MEADQINSVDSADGALALYELTNAFHSLSGDHRAVLRELHLRGASQDETAQRLGVPLGTVKSRAHHAMRILREAVDPAVKD